MVSATTDRRLGLTGDKAFKVPARVIATSNITLSGEQTIDGVAVYATGLTGGPDRVLANGQTDPTQNGIYDVSTGTWTRSLDANGTQNLVQGTQLLIVAGTHAGESWKCSTANPIVPGTSSLAFTQSLPGAASTISFLQAGTGAVTRTSQVKMRDIVSIKDFGADPSETAAHNYTYTQAALIAGTQAVYAPAGTYDINDVLAPASSTLFYGDGECTVFRQTLSNKNGISMIGKTWVTVEGMRFTNTSGAATGQALLISGGGNNRITNVRTDLFAEGSRISSTSPCLVENLYTSGNTSYGVHVMSASAIACVGITLRDVQSYVNTGSGVFIEGLVSGLYAHCLHSHTNSGSGLLVNSNGDGNPTVLNFFDLDVDSNSVNGIQFQNCNTIQLYNPWSSNRGSGKNFEIASTATGVTVFGGCIYNCYGAGIDAAGTYVSVYGTTIHNAGANTADTYDGISVTGAYFLSEGVRAYSDNTGATDKTRYGINLVAGATFYRVIGGDCSGVFNATKVQDAANHSGGIILGVGGAVESRIGANFKVAQSTGGVTLGGISTLLTSGSDNSLTLSQAGPLKIGSNDIQHMKALVALGGGAAPTVGTIGGSGPASAAQNSWMRFLDSAGNACWIPVWK